MEPITFDEVHVLDANSEYRGVPTLSLMENAGKGTAEHILETGGAGKRVLIICGSGNNGGDGYVAARYLVRKADVEVVLIRSRDQVRTEISRTNLRHAEEEGVPISVAGDDLAEKVSSTDILVDSMLGVGIHGPPKGLYGETVRLLNASGKRVISVDIPTGWGTELSVQPESTVTFHAPKIGMGEECGTIVVKPIGVPEEAMRFAGPGELVLIPQSSKDAHKGMRGNVLVVGGGPYTGAPALAAIACHRCGTDLVYVAVPGGVADVVSSYSMDLIVMPMGGRTAGKFDPTQLDAVIEAADRAHAVVIGPGIGEDPGSVRLASEAYRRFAEMEMPVVVDADGLKAFNVIVGAPANPKAVLTPHAGEFAAIAGKPLPDDLEERSEAVRELASGLGCTILAKGPIDVISDGTQLKLNDSGNSAMATGGTGDVLSGTVGAFLAKGMSAFDAARTAAFVAGAAGDEALAVMGHSLLASDMLSTLPGVFSRYLRWWTRK
jgi:NAD(P)H-hydrate epimerase